MNLKEVLVKARARVEHGWTRGCHAKNASGNSVSPSARDAVCWCLEGAVIAERSSSFTYEDFRLAMDALAEQIPAVSRVPGSTSGQNVVRYNDVILKSRQEALAWLDKAIEACA